MLLPRRLVLLGPDREQRVQQLLLLVEVGEQGMHLGARLLRVVRAGDGRDGVDGRSGGGQHVGQGRPLTRGVGVLLLVLGHVIGAIQHCPGGRAQGDVGPLQAR